MHKRHFLKLSCAALAAGLPGCGRPAARAASGKTIIRFGHFPNITHVQALVAHQLTRQGKGWFEERLGAEIQWFSFNAGPSAVEALFAGSLDVTYIGPSPVLNAYARSRGAEPRILAGAARGGSALVVRPGAGIHTPADFRGKRVATPQLGNTQDVQARAWLVEQGFTVSQTGGDVKVIPTANADQMALFAKGQIDAVWTAEPWVSRLVLEAGAVVFKEDPDTNVTLLAARTAYVNEQPELIRKLKAAHEELTDWIGANPVETRSLIKAELEALTTARPGDELVERALARTFLSNEVSRESLEQMVRSARSAGFLKEISPLDQLLITP